MNKAQFKFWLADNGWTQKDLASVTEVSEKTISTYCKKNKFPKVFELALKGLEK